MKAYYLLLTCLLVSVTLSMNAQCPPPGFPDPGNTCPQAPILCENLDGYCSTINNNNIAQNFPGCPGWQLNNDEWFAFFAGSTSITIEVTPLNCSPGGLQGLQGGIYQACGPPWVSMDLQCACTEDPFILSSNNFVVGQVYWFVLDGCNGNVCDYTIDVLSGSTVGVPPDNPGPITGPEIVCANGSSMYEIDPVNAATIYNWTLTPSIGTINDDDNEVSINWGAAGGTTELCVDVENLCYANPTESCITIEVLPEPTASLSGSGILCAGQMGSIDLTINFTGDAPWEFVYAIDGVPQAPIETSDNPYILTVDQPGNYTLVSVTSVDGDCPGDVSGSAAITETMLESTFAVTNAECGQSDGAINLTPAGGNDPYLVNWSNGETTEDLANIPPGSYTVTITDDDGCTETLTIDVGDDQVTIDITGAVTANTTCNGGNGSINVTVSPTGTYTYNWSNGETTEDLANLEPGTYTLTVTLGVNCTQTADFTVPDEPNEPQLTATTVQTTCDLSNGSINLTVSGGVAPYMFSWSNGDMTEDLANIPAGSYTVTVTGANGCTNEASFTVDNNNPPINITGTVMANTSCNGGNGSINITVTPPGAYTYIWSNGETSEDLANLDPGTYTVTVSAGGSCTQEASFTIPDDPNEPNVNATVTETTCDLGNGAINISVSGGVPPYMFMWSNGDISEDLANIPAGTYTVTVTGANGCSTVSDITVGNNNPPINLSANITPNTTCLPGGNGSIDLSVSPPGTYTYTWSNGDMTQDLTNVPPGSYSVTVNGAGSCSATATFDIPDDPNEPVLTGNVMGTTCDLSNGGINLGVSGGVPPYMFNWSNGSMSEDLTNIPAGNYSVTVTGANGCSSTADFSVNNNNPNITITGNVFANNTCIGGNGSINITVTPPGTYTYVWSTGATTEDIANLPPGSYTVTVNGGGSCTQTATFDVPDAPNTPNLTFTTINPTCGLSNGSINLSVNGGAPPFTYLWSSGQMTQDINNLPQGSYTVTVTGANGCTSEITADLNDQDVPITIDANITAQTSCIVNNGAINLILSPPGLSVSWSNGSMSSNLTNIGAGTYTVTVSAGGTCTQEATFEVPDNREFPFIAYDITPATCNFPNGSIDLEVFNGVEPYSYQWSHGPITQDVANLPANAYSVTVTTALGCSTVEFFDVTNEDIGITVFGVVNDNNSCTQPNGFIDIDVTPPGNYLYQWSNNATTEDLNNLAAGVYTVTVTQGTCVGVSSFEVFNTGVPPNLSLAVTPAICSQNNGAIDLSVSGASPPYTYNWSNMATTQDLNNLPPGTYTVTVTDFFGCSSTATGTVTSTNIAINITGVTIENTSCSTPNGSIDITVTPTAAYTYTWSNMANTQDIANLAAGTYSVTVSAGGACTATANFTILNNTVDPVLTATITPSICSVDNGAIDLSVTNGAAPYSFQWSNMANTEDVGNLFPGLYSVTVTDANGCVADTTLDVPNNASTFSLSGTATALTSCLSPNGSVNLTVTPAGPYTYLWSNGEMTEDISNLPPGTYTVSVTESGSCTASASFIVADNRSYPSINQSVTPEVCGLSNGAINVSVTGGTLPYNFLWSGGQMLEDLSNIPAGDYTITVTGASGCADTASITVPANDINFSLSATTAGNTSCLTPVGTIDLTVTPAGTYTFQWSNMAATEDLSGLPAGSYTVTVSAGGTCTSTATYTVANNTLSPLIAENIVPAQCGQSSGDINITVSSGQAPFNYSWSNMATTEDLINVPAGNYSVTVTGSNGCTATRAFTVTDDVIIPTLSAIVTANGNCVTPNGAINLSVSPALTYSFMWSSGQMTQSISGLQPGDYSVTVNGGGACIGVDTFTVGSNTLSPVVNGLVSNAQCGQSSGAIDLSVSGGQSPYLFLWSNMAAAEDLTNIPAGSYTVTVTGANGCTANTTFTVPDDVILPVVSGVVTPNTSCVLFNGAIDLTAGPAPSYQYSWSSGQNVADISDLASGDYTVTVNGGGACITVETFTVPNNTAGVALSGQDTDILCFGDNDGAIDLTISGGAPPYVIDWTPFFPGNPEDLMDLSPGVYTVTVTDSLGCADNATFTITQPAAAVQLLCVQTNNVSIPGAGDGEASVTVSGGVAPYTIVWSPGSVQSNVPAGPFDIDNLNEGVYNVTVTDANGCTEICDFAITPENCETTLGLMSGNTQSLCGPGCLTAVYDATGQFLDPDDVLQFILHEGSGLQIVNEIARSNQPEFCFDPAVMSFGVTYYISAVAGDNDGNGNVLLSDFCTVVAAGTPIVFVEKPVVTIGNPDRLNCVVREVSLTATASLPGGTFTWSTIGGGITGDPTLSQILANSAGAYTVVLEVNGCADTAQVAVQDISNLPVATIMASPDDILDCTINEIVLAGTIEGSLNANAIWLSNGQVFANGITLTINDPGTYQFVILDTISLCTDTASITINENQAFPPLFVDPPGFLNCLNPSVTLSGGSPIAGISFAWAIVSGTDTTIIGNGSSVNVSQPGTYYLIGTDPVNNCLNALDVTVDADLTAPLADAGEDFSIDCFGETAYLDGSASAGLPGFTFQWTTSDGVLVAGQNTSAPEINQPGVYTLLVTNPGNGCTDTDVVVISPEEPVAVLTVNDPPCIGDRGTIIIDTVIGGQPPIRYSLDNGGSFTTQSVFVNLNPGNYTILVEDAFGCSTSVEAVIGEPQPFEITVEPQLIVSLGDSIQIVAEILPSNDALGSVSWQPPAGLSCDTCLNPYASPIQSTLYRVTVISKEGCEDRAPVLVLVDKQVDIYVPNIFSPNGDGENDVFMIFADPKNIANIKSFQVYSRWGELVYEYYNFQPNNPAFGWDGRFRGQDLNPAVFVWYAVVEYIDGREVLYEGDVTIKR